jgi:hypothetical protein
MLIRAIVLAYSGPLGFLDRLSHVVMLLLSGVRRKDGQLVELDAVQKRRPGTNANALIRTSIHANPGVLGVHFVGNLVPLNLRIADNKATEHLVRLLGFGDRKALLSLEDLHVLGKHLPPDFLCSFGLVFRELEIGLHFSSNFENRIPGHLDIRRQSFFLDNT